MDRHGGRSEPLTTSSSTSTTQDAVEAAAAAAAAAAPVAAPAVADASTATSPTAASRRVRPRAAYCTLITSDSFLPGVQVLAFSLRAARSRAPLVILHTSALSEHSIAKMHKFPGCAVRAVEEIPNPNAEVHVEGWVNSG